MNFFYNKVFTCNDETSLHGSFTVSSAESTVYRQTDKKTNHNTFKLIILLNTFKLLLETLKKTSNAILFRNFCHKIEMLP